MGLVKYVLLYFSFLVDGTRGIGSGHADVRNLKHSVPAALNPNAVTRGGVGMKEPVHLAGKDQSARTRENVRRGHKKSRGVNGSGNGSSRGQDRGNSRAGGDGELKKQAANGMEGGLGPPREVHRAGSYEQYRRVVEEHDEELLRKYSKKLDTTIIFAGCLSAVSFVLLILLRSEFPPNPNAPQSTGPLNVVMGNLPILLASLAVSISTFFAIRVGMQRLTQYASNNMRKPAVEHS